MPALQESDLFEFAGIGMAAPSEWNIPASLHGRDKAILDRKREREKAGMFVDSYGGRVYDAYQAVVEAPEIDAVYIPLPPALHARWSKAALENGKHVFVEKPMATTLEDARGLIAMAKDRGLALHENYMFLYHRQLHDIEQVMVSGELGHCMLYRISFGYPRRPPGDFRYNRALGGGALLDCGGYTLCFAKLLLGKNTRLVAASSTWSELEGVDIYGSAMLVNDEGTVAQVAFGMDNEYRCDLEVWGSRGCLTVRRVLTAPPDCSPVLEIRKSGQIETRPLPMDNAFSQSIRHFKQCIDSSTIREKRFNELFQQASLLETFRRQAGFDYPRTLSTES